MIPESGLPGSGTMSPVQISRQTEDA